MDVLFRLTLFLLAACVVVGAGAVCFSVSLAPRLRRLDATDAAAVAQSTYRAGARRNELALLPAGPLLVVAAAASDGRLPWSAWWLWAALACWSAAVGARAAVVEPARRAALVVLGELAGTGPVEVDAKRALLDASLRRGHLGSLLVAACVAVALGSTALGA